MTCMATTAPTKPWTGPPRSRRAISTTARSRSTAAPMRSSATSSPRRCWGFSARDYNTCRPPRRRGTQYAAAVVATTSACDYWIPAFAGMTTEGHFVGWVERSDTHHNTRPNSAMGFASLYPSYGFVRFPCLRHDLREQKNMDFDLSEEQRLLKESIDGLLTDSYDFDARKKYQKEKGGWSKAVWGKLAEQGLLGLPFAEADGGFGAGAVETMIVMEALGKALVLEPYLATVVIAGGFLRHGGSAEQKTAHIPGIIDGSKTFAFAQLEK